MYKSTLIELMYKFTPGELKKFELFLRSPYHNKLTNPLKLFLEVKKFAPDYESNLLDKEIMWQKIFPGKKFNYGVMKNLIHEITKLGMKFLTIEYLENSKPDQDDMLLTQLFLRNCRKLYSQKVKQVNSQYSGNFIKKIQPEAETYFKFKSKLYWQEAYFEKINEIKLPEKENFQSSSHYLTYSYIISLVKQLNNIIANSYDNNYDLHNNLTLFLLKNFSEGLFEKVIEDAKYYPERDNKVIETYIALGNALIDLGNNEAYYLYKKKLIENRMLFSKLDLKDLFNCLSTVLSHLDKSNDNVIREFLSNFEYMAEMNILTQEDGTLGINYYYYYITAAFKVLKFEKIEIFSKKFLKKLNDDKQENAKLITKALLAFGEGRYDEALQIISKADPVALFLKFFIREFRACCLYELNERQVFENEYRSLYHFLKNNKLDNPRLSKSIDSHMKNIKKLFMLKEKFNIDLYTKLDTNTKGYISWTEQKLREIDTLEKKSKKLRIA